VPQTLEWEAATLMLEKLQATVRKVPRGKVSTYGAIAAAAGHKGAARQVVWALRAAGRTLPWHRVVSAGGVIRTTGETAMEQRLRLEMEGVRFRGKKVDMAKYEHKFARKNQRKSPRRK
jgi:methylated-DNA-protein-cysteine methyltransferase-like protein